MKKVILALSLLLGGLVLGFEEGEIAFMRQTRPQVISNAKARANQKLFMSNDSASLKSNLTGLIAS